MKNNGSEQQILGKLLLTTRTAKTQIPLSNLTSAAVLVIIDFSRPTEPCILLTQRAHSLRHHPGQFCFPGGKPELGIDNSLIDTAYRETFEEIGIRSALFSTTFELNEFKTLSGFSITPYITTLNQTYETKINNNEVGKILKLPLSFILKPSNIYQIKLKRDKLHFPVYAFSFEGNLVWGATAGILVDLASWLYTKEPADYLNQINHVS